MAAFPTDYAMTENNLGNAYGDMAEVRGKEDNLKKSIAAYGEALQVYTMAAFLFNTRQLRTTWGTPI